MKKYCHVILLMFMLPIIYSSSAIAQSSGLGSTYNIVFVQPTPQVMAAHENWISTTQGQMVLGTGNYVFTGDYIKILSPAHFGTLDPLHAPAQWYFALYAFPDRNPSYLAAVLISADGKVVYFINYASLSLSTIDLEIARNYR
jgi:hypothetical protein